MYTNLKTAFVLSLGLIALCSANIHPAAHFNPDEDARALKRAVQGWGTDEAAIIDIYAHRSRDQRQQIAQSYRRILDLDLDEDIADDTSGDFYDILWALLQPLPDYFARIMTNAGEQSEIITDTVVDASAQEMQDIMAAYNRLRLGNVALPTLLCRQRQRVTHNMIRKAFAGARSTDDTISDEDAQADANVLIEGQGRDIEEIFVTRSYKQLRKIFKFFEYYTKKSIDDYVEEREDFHEDLESGIKAIIGYTYGPAMYFARRVHESVYRWGTNDKMLIRVITSRSEKDLDEIKEAYEEMFGQSLSSMVYDDTSGDFRDILMAIIEQ